MEASDRFQGLCLQGSEGSQYMEQFDQMPPKVRARLKHSPFNICAGCITLAAGSLDDEDVLFEAIDSFEAQIRQQAV